MCGKAKGIMVNGVPRKVRRQKKPWGCRPRGFFGRGTSQGTPFNTIPSRLFHTMSLFCRPQLVLVPRKYHTEYTPLAFTNIDSVKSNIRVRDLEGIYIGL